MRNRVFQRKIYRHQLRNKIVTIYGDGESKITYKPLLLSLVQRVTPQLIANDIVGVQPMAAPTGSIFTLKVNSLSDRIDAFESHVCDIVDILRDDWKDLVFSNKEIWQPCVKLLHRLCFKGEISAEELDEMNNALTEVFELLDAKYPDCAFDLQMRGINKVWSD